MQAARLLKHRGHDASAGGGKTREKENYVGLYMHLLPSLHYLLLVAIISMCVSYDAFYRACY